MKMLLVLAAAISAASADLSGVIIRNTNETTTTTEEPLVLLRDDTTTTTEGPANPLVLSTGNDDGTGDDGTDNDDVPRDASNDTQTWLDRLPPDEWAGNVIQVSTVIPDVACEEVANFTSTLAAFQTEFYTYLLGVFNQQEKILYISASCLTLSGSDLANLGISAEGQRSRRADGEASVLSIEAVVNQDDVSAEVSSISQDPFTTTTELSTTAADSDSVAITFGSVDSLGVDSSNIANLAEQSDSNFIADTLDECAAFREVGDADTSTTTHTHTVAAENKEAGATTVPTEDRSPTAGKGKKGKGSKKGTSDATGKSKKGKRGRRAQRQEISWSARAASQASSRAQELIDLAEVQPTAADDLLSQAMAQQEKYDLFRARSSELLAAVPPRHRRALLDDCEAERQAKYTTCVLNCVVVTGKKGKKDKKGKKSKVKLPKGNKLPKVKGTKGKGKGKDSSVAGGGITILTGGLHADGSDPRMASSAARNPRMVIFGSMVGVFAVGAALFAQQRRRQQHEGYILVDEDISGNMHENEATPLIYL